MYRKTQKRGYTQWVFTCSKLTMKTLDQGVLKANKKDTRTTSVT